MKRPITSPLGTTVCRKLYELLENAESPAVAARMLAHAAIVFKVEKRLLRILQGLERARG